MIGPVAFFLTSMGFLFAGLFLGMIIGYAEGAKNNLPDIIIQPPDFQLHSEEQYSEEMEHDEMPRDEVEVVTDEKQKLN